MPELDELSAEDRIPSETSWFGKALRVIERDGRAAFSDVYGATDAPDGEGLIVALIRDGWAVEATVSGYLILTDKGEAWCRREEADGAS